MIEFIDKIVPMKLKERFGVDYKYMSYPYDLALRKAPELYGDVWMPLFNVWRVEPPEIYKESTTFAKFKKPGMAERDTSGTYPFTGTQMTGKAIVAYEVLLVYQIDFLSKRLSNINDFDTVYLEWSEFNPYIEIDYTPIGYPDIKHKCTCIIDPPVDNSDVSRYYDEGEFFRHTGNVNMITPIIKVEGDLPIVDKVVTDIKYYIDETG